MSMNRLRIITLLKTGNCERARTPIAWFCDGGPSRNGGVDKEKIAYVDEANECAQPG